MKLLALCLVLFAATLTAKADTLYTQAPTDPNSSGGNFSGTHAKVADNFTLSSAGTISSVSWWGGGVSDNHFTINFFSDASGVPGTLLESNSATATASTSNGGETYLYDASVSNFAAAAGTQYWFQVLSDTAMDWYWLQSAAGDNQHYEDLSYFGGQSGLTLSDMSFSLSNSVVPTPEPSSLALLGTGLLATGLALRRRVLPLRQ